LKCGDLVADTEVPVDAGLVEGEEAEGAEAVVDGY